MGLDFRYSTLRHFPFICSWYFSPQIICRSQRKVNPECIVNASVRLPRLIKLQLWKVYEWSQGGYNDRGRDVDSALGTGINHSLPCWVSLSLNLSETRVATACPNSTELLDMHEISGIPGILICMQLVLRCPVRKLWRGLGLQVSTLGLEMKRAHAGWGSVCYCSVLFPPGKTAS